jgi:hypothetical protein
MEKDGVLKLPVMAKNDAQTKHFFDKAQDHGYLDRHPDRRAEGVSQELGNRHLSPVPIHC